MSLYSEQITRIREKLKLARKADPDLDVFGAISHRYELDAPISNEALTAFEEKYGIELPDCYRVFLMELGNGGAGPFYGLYRLGEGLDGLHWEEEEVIYKLHKPCLFSPEMTDDQWKEIASKTKTECYSGALSLGSQGCTYFHALILNGKYCGKVVNINADSTHYNPCFTFEAHFLDWYERWLDEVISGDLIGETAAWFGYAMGGSEEKMLEDFPTFREGYLRDGCLRGLLRKKKLSSASIQTIQLIYDGCNDQEKAIITQILTKFDYEISKPYLTELAENNLLVFFQTIHWYCREKAIDWRDLVESKFRTITDSKTFDFSTYVLDRMKIDYGELLVPFTLNSDAGIRRTAYYNLGKFSNKQNYVDVSLSGVEDCDKHAVIQVLQALKGIKDSRLLPAYKALENKYPTDNNIRANLNHRLKEMGANLL